MQNGTLNEGDIPRQLILFGSPGTGKSHRVKTEILPALGIGQDGGAEDSPHSTRVVFHPEYTYGDWVGKLMPLTNDDGDVEYHFYPGHFTEALGQAYENILQAGSPEEAQNVALVVEEINRGNSAAIFGTTFQLLDRTPDDAADGWSEYPVQLSKMEHEELFNETGLDEVVRGGTFDGYDYNGREYGEDELYDKLELNKPRKVRIPPNLYLVATMNTSNESIFQMDVAFKRRWSWQYVDIEEGVVQEDGVAFQGRADWEQFVSNLNEFIRLNHKYVRRVEDKQIGHWFLEGEGKGEKATFYKEEIQNKVMFFLWDSVFASSKKPLAEHLLGVDESDLVTFGSFARRVASFIGAIEEKNWSQEE
ncbi:hypothetical protein [Salinibacter ruber]|uniref:hypothetical protein n=1 Tax=Salinibacter ruber TaxID=146919 RepID=UPI0021689328|nr:hypothetical protein [Salinibacter ruber]MCS4054106.1 5-methylcytosine-specific restriction endonuclease McrBC GTP-binding regulatory subunit McrB [Salinibacter ruber]